MRLCSNPKERAKATRACPPMDVAKEFNAADPGGKLPYHKRPKAK